MIRKIGEFVPFGSTRLPVSEMKFKLEENGVELSWAQNQLIWSKHRCLLHDLLMPGPIIEATMCHIDDTDFLAVLYESGLTLYSLDGKAYKIPLPFQISMIFPLHKALLLLRSASVALIHSQYEDFPILFTLFHPLEEIRPVAFYTPISIRSPLPKYTTIRSPGRGIPLTPPMKKTGFANEDKLRFITDLSFQPVMVSKEKCYMLAKSQESASIWVFDKQEGNRDLLYTSPMFVPPSIFSPPPQSITTSPRVTRAEMKATLEGIPPDLFMEMIFEFNQVDPDDDITLTEISEGKVRYILIVHGNELQALDVNSSEVAWNVSGVLSVCKFDKLMYFVVTVDNRVVLYERDNAIVQFSFTDIVQVQKSGRNFVLLKTDGTGEKFQFEITFDPVAKMILDIAHKVMNREEYSTLILSLSESDCLGDCDVFISTFVELLISLVAEHQTLLNFIDVSHKMLQCLRVQKGTEYTQQKLIDFLMPLVKHFGMNNHIMYYAWLSDSSNFEASGALPCDDQVTDLMFWCHECLKNRAVKPIETDYMSLAWKLVKLFGSFDGTTEIRDIVVATERSKLSLDELYKLHPAILAPLQEAFKITANSPPSTWPLEAYSLVGRPDIRTVKEYVEKPTDKGLTLYEETDLRFIEIERLLQSHMPFTVDVERPNGTDDIEFQDMLVARARKLFAKQWSLSYGRGLFKFATFEPISSQRIEKREINKVGLTTAGVEISSVYDWDVSEITDWSCFSNGACDALSVVKADYQWLVDTVNSDDTSYGAGLLFGFGVSGLLRQFWKADAYKYLTSDRSSDLHTIAMLLGLGLSYRGSKDLGISHMFTLHIPELGQFEEGAATPSVLVQAAARLGIGLLFEGSGQRHLTESFIALIDRSSCEQPTQALLAAYAVGLVNLGMGDNSAAMRENREKLCFIVAGSKVADAPSLDMVTFGNSDHWSIVPAAIVALTLSYMNTNHSRMKMALDLTGDVSFINSLQGGTVFARTLGLCMIDSDPNAALNFKIPDGLDPNVLLVMVSALALAMGIRFAGTLNKKVYEKLMTWAKCLCLLEKEPFDFTNACSVHCQIYLATVLLSASLVIAGTCDIEFIRFARYVRRRPISTNIEPYVYGSHTVYGMAIGTVTLGKGRFTLSNSQSAMATLLCAMYARFPMKPWDNGYNLQAARFLYVHAIIPRVLEVRDVDTDKIINCYAVISLTDGQDMPVKTPHVLPPLDTIQSVRINHSQYYSVELTPFPFKDEKVRPIIWLKKKPGESATTDVSVSTLRSKICMKENQIYRTQLAENESKAITEFNMEWDSIADKIMQFLRSTDVAERIAMMNEEKRIKDFLEFYGLLPSVTMKDAALFDEGALAFLLPHMNEEEFEQTFA